MDLCEWFKKVSLWIVFGKIRHSNHMSHTLQIVIKFVVSGCEHWSQIAHAVTLVAVVWINALAVVAQAGQKLWVQNLLNEVRISICDDSILRSLHPRGISFASYNFS